MDDFDNSDICSLALEMANLKLEIEQNRKRIAELEAQFDRYCWINDGKLREHELVLKHLGSKSE